MKTKILRYMFWHQFPKYDTNIKAVKVRVNKGYYIKLKYFYTAKETINRKEKQAMQIEKNRKLYIWKEAGIQIIIKHNNPIA